MTDNNSNDTSNSPDSSNIELDDIVDIEKYIIHSKSEITQKLRLLAKSKSAINGYFNNGNGFFLTSVIEVLRDKKLLVLDISSDPELTQKITNADNIIFKAKHQGITAQFKTSSIQTVKFQGQQFFACAIPEQLLWVQRRENFRVSIPRSNNAIFQFHTEQGDMAEHRIIDVSGVGIAIADESFSLKMEAGYEFNNVNLIFSNELSCSTSLTVQNTLPLNFSDPSKGQRLGCHFNGLATDFAADLQRFINQLDSEYRKSLSE